MNKNLQKAREILLSNRCTCVLCREDTVLTDHRRGIRPLLELYRSGQDLHGFSAADKVVGKAAAFLYWLMGVKAVYAQIISAPAAKVLAQGGIALEYGTLVSAIQNRDNTGFCPMETAVWDIENPTDAPAAIEKALAQLN